MLGGQWKKTMDPQNLGTDPPQEEKVVTVGSPLVPGPKREVQLVLLHGNPQLAAEPTTLPTSSHRCQPTSTAQNRMGLPQVPTWERMLRLSMVSPTFDHFSSSGTASWCVQSPLHGVLGGSPVTWGETVCE